MKTLFRTTILSLLLFIPFISFAQPTGFKYGARFGIGSASFVSDGDNNFKNKLLLQAGVATAYNFTPNLGVMADFLLTSKGSKNSGTVTETFLGSEREYDYNETYNFFYGEIPLMARLQFGNDDFIVKVYGGPSFNFNLVSTETREFEDENYNEDNGYEGKEIEDLDVMEKALVIGGGIDVNNGAGRYYYLDLRYSKGMDYFRLFNNNEAFTSYFSINIGHLF